MPLTAEQQRLIRSRLAADSASPAAAFALWLFLGFAGAHRFYLKRAASGAALAALCLFGAGLMVCAVLFGGTPLDGIFYRPDIGDILRAGDSAFGTALFYAGAAALAALALRWLADGLALRRLLAAEQAARRAELIAYFDSYRPV